MQIEGVINVAGYPEDIQDSQGVSTCEMTDTVSGVVLNSTLPLISVDQIGSFSAVTG